MEHNVFWIEIAGIRREEILVEFCGVFHWFGLPQEGIASIANDFHEPGAPVAAAEAAIAFTGETDARAVVDAGGDAHLQFTFATHLAVAVALHAGIVDHAPGPAELAETSDSLSMAFLVLLESLSPPERAVFLLREVFGYGYPEIADVTGKTEAACRQIFARARRHVDEGRPRFETSRAEGEELTGLFLAAARGINEISVLVSA